MGSETGKGRNQNNNVVFIPQKNSEKFYKTLLRCEGSEGFRVNWEVRAWDGMGWREYLDRCLHLSQAFCLSGLWAEQILSVLERI